MVLIKTEKDNCYSKMVVLKTLSILMIKFLLKIYQKFLTSSQTSIAIIMKKYKLETTTK